jgi:hypothetical protein
MQRVSPVVAPCRAVLHTCTSTAVLHACPYGCRVLCSRYTFLYKQAVGTQDTYLGMSHKDPSTTCCEQLVVRVDMPAANNIKGGWLT